MKHFPRYRRGLFQLKHNHLHFLFTLGLSDIGFVQLVVTNVETSSQTTTIYRLPGELQILKKDFSVQGLLYGESVISGKVSGVSICIP